MFIITNNLPWNSPKVELKIRRRFRVVVENWVLKSREFDGASTWWWGSSLNLREIGQHSGLEQMAWTQGSRIRCARNSGKASSPVWNLGLKKDGGGSISTSVSGLRRRFSLNVSAFYLEIWARFIERLTQHGAAWSSFTLRHTAWCCVSFFGCLLHAFCPI